MTTAIFEAARIPGIIMLFLPNKYSYSYDPVPLCHVFKVCPHYDSLRYNANLCCRSWLPNLWPPGGKIVAACSIMNVWIFTSGDNNTSN